MHMLQSILLATDFLPASHEAAQAAVRLANKYGSRVTPLHVLEPIPTWPVTLPHEWQEATEPLEKLANHLTAQNVSVAEPVMAVGSAADQIVRKAQEVNADLIVIGAGEKTHFERLAAGPVAEAVIARASQPVLAVRPGAAPARFKKILCPVDQSPASQRGLRNAIQLAKAFDGQLLVLTVVPKVSWLSAAVETGRLAHAETEHEHRWRQEFRQFLEGIEFGRATWEQEVGHGVVDQEILAAAQRFEADVIIMGSTGRTGLVRTLLGSVTRRVLRQLPCSLLTVKEEDVVEELFEDDLRHVSLLLAEGRGLLATKSALPALAKFRQVSAHAPFNAAALEGQAEAYEHLGQAAEAERCRRRAKKVKHHAGV